MKILLGLDLGLLCDSKNIFYRSSGLLKHKVLLGLVLAHSTTIRFLYKFCFQKSGLGRFTFTRVRCQNENIFTNDIYEIGCM